MKRNSTTLFLESPGAVTPVPWVDGAPNISGFTDPTLSVLQQSWAAFLESGQEIEVIPDPVQPPPSPEPDWTAFNTAMLSDPDWSPWITQNSLLMAATTSASMSRNAPELQTTLETAISVLGQPDPVAAQRWQSIADANSIPIRFGEP